MTGQHIIFSTVRELPYETLPSRMLDCDFRAVKSKVAKTNIVELGCKVVGGWNLNNGRAEESRMTRSLKPAREGDPSR
jgi:hypothetical protein